MSAWSDYKCGALTDEEYKFCVRREMGEDHGEDEMEEYDDPEEQAEDDA